MKKLRYKIIVSVVCVLCVAKCFAQNTFKYKANLAEVKQSGFYKVSLPPSVIAKCQLNLEDVRILDNKGNQTAYIKQPATQFSESSFIEFPIINKAKEKDKQTHITIENKTDNAINHLLLFTSNMDAKRVVNISGSNDLGSWYIIKESIWLDNYFNNNGEELVQTISLPTVNYKYFQITIIGENLLPFNTTKAGVYKENFTKEKYVSIPTPTIIQKDSSNKKSYIQVSFNDTYTIDKLILEIDGVKFFKRNISIYTGDNFSTKTPFSTFINLTRSEVFFSRVKVSQLLIVINNDDNIPLKIKSINGFQSNQYLLTYLEANQKYDLIFGDSLVKAPIYDLNFFKDSIGNMPKELEIGSVENISNNKKPLTGQPKIFNQIFLWSIIGIVSLGLLLFTFKIITELNKHKSDVNI